jgi:amidase
VKIEEYARYDATGLAELIKAGDVSADEVHAAAVAAIEKVRPRIGAVAAEPWSEPLAHDPAGAFGGVPFALKDLVCHAAGCRLGWGAG